MVQQPQAREAPPGFQQQPNHFITMFIMLVIIGVPKLNVKLKARKTTETLRHRESTEMKAVICYLWFSVVSMPWNAREPLRIVCYPQSRMCLSHKNVRTSTKGNPR